LILNEDIEFIPLREAQAAWRKLTKAQLEGPQRPTKKLQALLHARDNREGKYQELLEGVPWALGMHYSKIQRHTSLDDENIPDFTGVRSHGGFRDVIEVKPPFMPVVKRNGHFTADFNAALDQAERYLNFVQADRDYLARKGLHFKNPNCLLIVGYDLFCCRACPQKRSLRRWLAPNPNLERHIQLHG